ncbi:MAG: YggS family pyridoxal phosphate-dependent enzyme [Elusimicrobia bacterium]|nr:YggS family pyridoxal phosphate-dependent enzyme [Elusimicrobiota bacterium]
MVQDRLSALSRKIRDVCLSCGRDPAEVTLVGVTKTADVPRISEALTAGLSDIAENRVQVAREKFPRLNLRGVRTHLIGHLQTNKVKEAVGIFDLIQSVDSIKLADEISKRAGTIGKVQDILLQVDIAKEEQKFGLPEEEAERFVSHVAGLQNVRLLGLMTMAPLTGDRELIRSVFRQARKMFDAFKSGEHEDRIEMRHLSMGMSGDFEIAISEGANMVRVGSAIFDS